MSYRNIIEKQIYSYIFDSPNIQYSLLLNGGWGTGKTHFIKNTLLNENKELPDTNIKLKDKLAKNNFDQVCYISLFGIDTIDELNATIELSKLPENIQPIAKKSRHFGGMLGSTIDSFAKILEIDKEVDSMKKIGGNIKELIGMFPKEPSTKRPKYVIIIYDLERCTLDPQEFFGVINQLVEHEKHKVILLSNEKALDEKYDKNQSLNEFTYNYSDIKEKLVGYTITYDPNLEDILLNILDSFSEANNSTGYDFLKKTQQDNIDKNDKTDEKKSGIEKLSNMAQTYEIKNLRTLSFVMDRFLQYMSILDKNDSINTLINDHVTEGYGQPEDIFSKEDIFNYYDTILTLTLLLSFDSKHNRKLIENTYTTKEINEFYYLDKYVTEGIFEEEKIAQEINNSILKQIKHNIHWKNNEKDPLFMLDAWKTGGDENFEKRDSNIDNMIE